MEAGDHLVVLGPNERLAALNHHADIRAPAV